MNGQFTGKFDLTGDFDTTGLGEFGVPMQDQTDAPFDLDIDNCIELDDTDDCGIELDIEDDGIDLDINESELGPQISIQGATPTAPLYLNGDYTEVGVLKLSSTLIKEYYDNALHLDKKDIQTQITVVAVNNYCFIYSLNVGIEMYAVYGCEYDSAIPLAFSLPINKVLKLLNTDEVITFNVEDDELYIIKARSKTSIMKNNLYYIKECEEIISNLYGLYEQPATDVFDNEELHEVIQILNPYSRMNQADKRIILMDTKVAYVRSVGYYVFKKFKTNVKYLINTTFANLLLKLCKSSTLEKFEIKILVSEDKYTVISNNYVLNFPIIDGDFKFNVLGKIQPTAVYSMDKTALKQALSEIDMYTERKCAITFNETALLQNKTVQGNALQEVVVEKLEDSRPESIPTTYLFDYEKFSRVINPIKSDCVVLMECNTQEHLYITDKKMSYYVILSVK